MNALIKDSASFFFSAAFIFFYFFTLFPLIADRVFLFWASPYVWEDTTWTELSGEPVASVVAIFATRFSSPISRLSCLSASIPLYLRGVDVSVEYLGLGLHVTVKRNFVKRVAVYSRLLFYVDLSNLLSYL